MLLKRVIISWAGFQEGHQNYWHITELSSVLFGGISCYFLPYSERRDIAINHFIISLLRELPHKIYLHCFCFGYKIQWLQSYWVPKSVQNIKSHKMEYRVCTISQSISMRKITLAWMVNMIFCCWSWIFAKVFNSSFFLLFSFKVIFFPEWHWGLIGSC